MSDLGPELVPARIDYHDERGWTDQESATTDKIRKVWAVEAGKSYIRVQSIGDTSKTFPAKVEPVSLDITVILVKYPDTGFPGVFYYNIPTPVAEVPPVESNPISTTEIPVTPA